jgi:hypothetical protein
MVSTIQPAVFDALDGDPDLSIAYKYVAYPPRNWDLFNVQVYSSQQAANNAPYFIWHRVNLARLVLEGRPLTVSLGILGEGSMQGEAGFLRLVAEVQLCRALGVEEVILFSLGRGLRAFGPDFVSDLDAATKAAARIDVGFSRAVAVMPYGASLWDALLDLRGSRGLIVLGWCIAVVVWRIGFAHFISVSEIKGSA